MGFDVIRLPDMAIQYYRKIANEIEASGAASFSDEDENLSFVQAYDI